MKTTSLSSISLVIIILSLCESHSNAINEPVFHDYCVVGAGPGGLQMGYFLERAGRDYVVFERSNVSGHFFTLYPRHRTLISINKRNTGHTNKEFNLRHDWNSLLSDDESLQMRHYSKKLFPPADSIVDYLRDYQRKLGIKVQFETEISDIMKSTDPKKGPSVFTMKDQNQKQYTCQTLIIATGAATPIKPEFHGSELVVGYEDVPTDGEAFEGKTVMILGRGNAAFETADAIYGNTNYIHMMSRSRVRLSWSTHYVGDLRGINNGLLDTYQLKSLDGLAEFDVRRIGLVKNDKGKIMVLYSFGSDGLTKPKNDNNPLRDHYDVVIRCLGFKFDAAIFGKPCGSSGKLAGDEDQSADCYDQASGENADEGANPGTMEGKRKKKYPNIGADYEAKNVSGLYFVGTISHGVDLRESAGAFIHGFRYTTRALHRILEYRNHGVTWPHVTLPATELVPTIVKRINEASGSYQMFNVLGDVYAISDDSLQFQMFEEFPVRMIYDFANMTGCAYSRLLVNNMEYGADFSGPAADVFRNGRAVGHSAIADQSNFLHPVIYYYPEIPKNESNLTNKTSHTNETKKSNETSHTSNVRHTNETSHTNETNHMNKTIDVNATQTNQTKSYRQSKQSHYQMPEAAMIHHIVEDFTTFWDGQVSHIQPLRRFVEHALGVDLRRRHSSDCFQWILTHGRSSTMIPPQCKSYLLESGTSFKMAASTEFLPAVAGHSPFAPFIPKHNIYMHSSL